MAKDTQGSLRLRLSPAERYAALVALENEAKRLSWDVTKIPQVLILRALARRLNKPVSKRMNGDGVRTGKS